VIIDFELAFVETPDNKPTIMVENLVDNDHRELRDVWQHRSPCDIAGCCGKDSRNTLRLIPPLEIHFMYLTMPHLEGQLLIDHNFLQ